MLSAELGNTGKLRQGDVAGLDSEVGRRLVGSVGRGVVGAADEAVKGMRSESLKESIDATERLESVEVLGVDEP